MDLGRTAVVFSLLLVGSCDSSVAVSADAPRADLDAEGLPSLTFEHDWREAELCAVGESPVPDCCVGTRVELPRVAASLLDLRNITSGAPGTCGDPVKRILPSVASAYPLMVLLPDAKNKPRSGSCGRAYHVKPRRDARVDEAGTFSVSMVSGEEKPVEVTAAELGTKSGQRKRSLNDLARMHQSSIHALGDSW